MNFNFFKIVLVLLTALSFSATAQDISLNIVGNPGSVPKEMNMKQLQSILRGEQMRWDTGVAVKIALMKTSTPTGSYTCRRIYNMSPNDLNKYFLAQVFQGKVKAPMFFTLKSELESYVARTPGAIGVSQDAGTEGVNIVLVDGMKQI